VFMGKFAGERPTFYRWTTQPSGPVAQLAKAGSTRKLPLKWQGW